MPYRKIIKDAKNQNKLAIFVGSGVSKGSNLPDWGELIEELKQDIGIENETDFLKIAQLYYLAVGEVTYNQKIKSFFNKNSEPNELHKPIFDLKPKYLITTNWDTLLEQWCKDNYMYYKTISSDSDLVSTNIDKMIIKMHGDFNSDRFVFKEDDYINYSQNFPLIENFVKSILSTHTIIFIGYSYSDINLKYIFKWLENSSKLQPPMFYFTFSDNKNYEKYLHNFKIETVVIPKYDKPKDYQYRLERFLQELNDTVDEKNIDFNLDKQSSKSYLDVLTFIYKKLKLLENQNYILREQISEVLGECNFEYHNKQTYLNFYTNELTWEFSKNSKTKRDVYNLFKNLLLNKDEIFSCFNQKEKLEIEEKLSSIFDIFIFSDIDGIIAKKEGNQFWPYDFSAKCSKDILHMYKNLFQDTFNLLDSDDTILKQQNNIFSLYHLREYKKAFLLNQKLISTCFQDNDYINLLFAYFNHNHLILELKNITLNEKFKNDVSETWAYSLQKYDLEEKFFELPIEVRNQLKTLKRFLTLDFLNNLYIKVDEEYSKKKEQEESFRDKKGMYLDSNVDRFYAWQKELVLFHIKNFVLVNRHSRFKKIHIKLLEIELIRGLNFEKMEFDVYQIYSFIHFVDDKTFKNMFYRFVNDEKYKDKLAINCSLQNYLFKLLENNYELYKNSKTPLNFNRDDEILNIIFLFSIIKIDKKIKYRLFKKFIQMIEEYNANISLYEAIGSFFRIQYNLFQNSINEENINKFYTMLLEKLLKYFNHQEINAWFYRAFEDGNFDISFMAETEVFENEELVTRFINKISIFEIQNQIKIILSFLLGIYKISKSKTRSRIKKYLLNIFKNIERLDMRLHFYLLFNLIGIKKVKKKKLLEFLKEYQKYLIDKNEFSYFNAIKNNLSSVIEKEKITDKNILNLSEKLNNIDIKFPMNGIFSV